MILLFSCCNNCKDPACPELSTEDASWFPYYKNDTLIFENTVDDSYIHFPFSYNGNWSVLHTPSDGDECNKYCIAGKINYSEYYFDSIAEFSSNFIINRIEENFYVVFSRSSSTVVNNFNPHSFFDLRHAIKLDTLSINGNLLEDVYHYTCYPQQEEMAETYVKKGMGMVKIVFRDGQEFELVEHIKAK